MRQIEKARAWAELYHKGQVWADNQPYINHLNDVENIIKQNLSHHPYCTEMQIAGLLHDIVEDTSVTLEQVKEEFGILVHDIVWAVTDGPGKNRKERKLGTYLKISATQFALPVKLADRISNVRASDSSSYFKMYQKEYAEFKAALYRKGEYEDLWNQLDNLLN